jgi:hypothetical protein
VPLTLANPYYDRPAVDYGHNYASVYYDQYNNYGGMYQSPDIQPRRGKGRPSKSHQKPDKNDEGHGGTTDAAVEGATGGTAEGISGTVTEHVLADGSDYVPADDSDVAGMRFTADYPIYQVAQYGPVQRDIYANQYPNYQMLNYYG